MSRFVPFKLAYSMAWIAEWLFKLLRRKDFLLSTDAVSMSRVFSRLSHDKARRELGWTPRLLEETVRDAVAWFAEQERSDS